MGSAGTLRQGKDYWSQPAKTGLLAGELIEITDQGYMMFEALDGSIHILDIAKIEKNTIFVDFLRVRMVGYESNGIYYPCVVAPWEVKKGRPEKRSDYGKLRDGNIQFSRQDISQENFRKTFERKSEIVRINRC